MLAFPAFLLSVAYAKYSDRPVSVNHLYQYLYAFFVTNQLWWLTDCQVLNPLTPELNPYAQHCLTRFFTGDFAS
jgi:hypothetical protein